MVHALGLRRPRLRWLPKFGQHRPVLQVADDVGPAADWDVAQVAVVHVVDLGRLRLHLLRRLLVLLLLGGTTSRGKIRMQPLEVKWRGEDVALDALAVLRHGL